MDLITIMNKLKLNASKYSNFELILTIFEDLNKKNKILIKYEENTFNILFKLTNNYNEEFTKIKLYKEYLNRKQMKDLNNKLNKNINKNEKEVKEIINKKDIINNNNLKNEEYMNKLNYKFKKNPNLKYKLDITHNNNYRFEIFISYLDNKEYLVSTNIEYYNLDIFRLLDNKIILSLKGHKSEITAISYFINQKNYNEYLISADTNRIVIIWDITNNYKIKYQINTNY